MSGKSVLPDQHNQNIEHEIKQFLPALAMSVNDGVLWKRGEDDFCDRFATAET